MRKAIPLTKRLRAVRLHAYSQWLEIRVAKAEATEMVSLDTLSTASMYFGSLIVEYFTSPSFETLHHDNHR